MLKGVTSTSWCFRHYCCVFVAFVFMFLFLLLFMMQLLLPAMVDCVLRCVCLSLSFSSFPSFILPVFFSLFIPSSLLQIHWNCPTLQLMQRKLRNPWTWMEVSGDESWCCCCCCCCCCWFCLCHMPKIDVGSPLVIPASKTLRATFAVRRWKSDYQKIHTL